MADEVSVSVRAFAKEIGKSHPLVLRMIKAGIIPRNEDGTIPLAEGIEAYREHDENRSPANARRSSALSKTSKVPDSVDSVSVNAKLNQAKLAEKTYQAKLKELEYRLKNGEIVEVEKVKADAQATASALRERLMSVPVRIAGMCEGRTTREIEEIIEDGINDALSQFQKSEFLK